MTGTLIHSIRDRAMNNCVNGCDPPFVMVAQSTNILKNAMCRCVKCLSYWEVTSLGEIVNRKIGLEKDIIITPNEEDNKDV